VSVRACPVDGDPPVDARGVRFAAVGAVGNLAGFPTVGVVAASFAMVAALLNAAVGFCLGCAMYSVLHPPIRRFRNDQQGAIA